MKRSVLYLIALLSLLIVVQFKYMQLTKQQSIAFGESAKKITLEDKQSLLAEWSLFGHDKTNSFGLSKDDIYIIVDTADTNILILKACEEGRHLKESVLFRASNLLIDQNDKEYYKSEDLLGRVQEEMYANDSSFRLRLTKEEIKNKVINADYVRALVKTYPETYLKEQTGIVYSRYYGFILLIAMVIIIWILDVISNWLSALTGKPHWVFLLVVLVIYILYESSSMFTDNSFARSGILRTINEVIFFTLVILSFILFFYYEKKYWRKLSFEDGEAAKFFFVLIIFSSILLLRIILDQWLVWGRASHDFLPFLFKDAVSYLVSPVLLIATANFLNNFRKRYTRLKGKEEAMGIAEESKLESEALLTSLQSKINPHFLYNSLNSIASLAKQDAAKTEEMTLALSKFYHYNTNRENKIWSTIGEEIELIKNYLAIEKIRFGEQLIYEVNCGNNLKGIAIPHFLLQPLVENAIKYGYSKTEECIHVKIDIDQTGSDLIMKIMDAGVPFSEDIQLGYGLESVQQKLKLCFPGRHQIDFVNTPQKGIVITLTLDK